MVVEQITDDNEQTMIADIAADDCIIVENTNHTPTTFGNNPDDTTDSELHSPVCVEDESDISTRIVSAELNQTQSENILSTSGQGLPIALMVLDPNPSSLHGEHIAMSNDYTERNPVSFAIGEPFIQESQSEKPVYLSRRAICIGGVIFFNATLILILLSLRDSRNPFPAVAQKDNVTTIISNTGDKERKELIKSYIIEHINTTKEVLDEPTTKQYAALEFLVNEDIFVVNLNQELLYVQRYIEILVMLSVSGRPHLILPEYVASRTNDDFIETMHISLTNFPSVLGTIPEEIGSLFKLRTLSLKGNRIEGSIPSEIGLLSDLVTLDLSENSIKGSIPTELGNLEKIQQIILSNNELTGSVPTEFSNLNLRVLSLHKNNLNGNISFLCNNDFEDNRDIDTSFGLTADCDPVEDNVDCTCCRECF